MFSNNPFSAPLAALGQGSQPPDFMPMPRESSSCHAPSLPQARALAAHHDALDVLHRTLDALQRQAVGAAVEPIELGHLHDAECALVDQMLGQGEVAAQVAGANEVQAQESMFAGVWRVVYRDGGMVVRDTVEVGAFPRAVAAAARADGRSIPPLPSLRPADTMNARSVLEELRERTLAWRSGDPAHVVNLSLMPLSRGDGELFEQQLGHGNVRVLARGNGNCRIANTRAAGVWRVTYFNSQDMIILDTLEVGDVPEVACAARQDLEASAERLQEMLQWVQAT